MTTKTEDCGDLNEKPINLADKFKSYRLDAQSTEQKLKESEAVIDQLKNEIKISKEVERNLRDQVSSNQTRLIQLQEVLNKVTSVLGQMRGNDKVSLEIERKVLELETGVKQIEDKTQNLVKIVSTDLDLLERNNNLKVALREKESECDFMKIEMGTLLKEKKEIVSEYEERIRNLEDQLVKSRRECTEVQTHCDKTILIYRRQIESNQQTIREYEKERKSLFEEFHPERGTQSTNNNDFVLTSSTDASNRSTESGKMLDKSNEERRPVSDVQEDGDFHIVRRTISSTAKKEKNETFFKMGEKRKPQLDFLSPDHELSQRRRTYKVPTMKRRLFSTNSNHYTG